MKTTKKAPEKSDKRTNYEKIKNMKAELISVKSDVSMTRIFTACVSFSEFLNSSGNI